mmetsp:Transcript_39612/g.114005  ORF Transcript_39612/g.114005 Transcript_39612/m.114005 type:complete len:274 (+) Transcript_39612:176-997(+)
MPGAPTADPVARSPVASRLLLQLRDLLGCVIELLEEWVQLVFGHPFHAGLLHDHHLDVLPRCLCHLEEALERQPQRPVLLQVLRELLLQEVDDALRVLADGRGLPSVVRACGVCLEELRLAVRVETAEQGGDAEGAHAAAVCVLLLRAGDVARDVVDGRCVLDIQAVGLALDARFVHEHPRIRVQAGECQGDVVVHHEDLPDRPRVLQLRRRALLHSQDDAVLAADADGGGALPDGLKGVLDLEEVPVGGEDGDSAIVAGHGSLWTPWRGPRG